MAAREALKEPIRERQLYQQRLTTAAVLVVMLLLVLVGRYFQLQVMQHETYRTQSDRNRIQLQPIAPKRGLIFDRNGALLAENIPSYSLNIVRERVEDIHATLDTLKSLIALDDDEIEKFAQRLQRRRPYQAVPLRFRLTEEEIATIAVNRYRMPGVEIHAELVRHYPQGELFAHVLGYVGRISDAELDRVDPVNYSGTHHIGKIGVEKYYEQALHGTVGYQNVETNARGRVLRVLERHDPAPGADLQLHIDSQLQRVAFDALQGERGAVVAMDPNTGGVLALVSTPSYDSNLFVNGISRENYNELQQSHDLPLFNRALLGQYPPGSTIKPIFGLAGLHYDVVTPATTMYDPGWYKLPNYERRFRDWKKGGHGSRVDLHQAIVESCDTYFYDLAYNLGIDRLHEFSLQFNLGRLTGIDSDTERRGLMPSRDWKRETRGVQWFPGETLNVGIGQGYMLATPLQLAVSTAILAKRGERHVPRLLKAVGGKPVDSPQLPTIKLARDEYWDTVMRSMEDVVHSVSGTARLIASGADYRMAGKTGTAQVIGIADHEEYNSEEIAKRNRDHALFVGYAPAEKPEIVVAVIVENGEHGSTTAAPIARRVFDAYMRGVAADDAGEPVTEVATGARAGAPADG